MRGHLGVQYLAQGPFGMQMGKTEDQTTKPSGGRPLYPSAAPINNF